MAVSREQEYAFAAFKGTLDSLHFGGGDVKNKHVKDAHAKLTKNGYVFVGWHGTTSKSATFLCNTKGAYAKSKGYDPAVFNGCYTSSDVERCFGYMGNPMENKKENTIPVILRVYLKHPWNISDVFLNSINSKNAIDSKDFSTSRSFHTLRQGRGRYMIGGPDGTDFPGYELLLSNDLTTEVAFTISSHTFYSIDVPTDCRYKFNRKSEAKERSNLRWSIEKGRTDFLNSLDRNNLI